MLALDTAHAEDKLGESSSAVNTAQVWTIGGCEDGESHHRQLLEVQSFMKSRLRDPCHWLHTVPE